MNGKYFSFTDVLSYGWRTMEQHIGFFIALGLIYLAVIFLPAAADITLSYTSSSNIMLHITVKVIRVVIDIILKIGMIKIALCFCDEKKPAISTLFDALGCFWRFVGTSILYGLIILGGFLFLIIPGIIWSVQFSLCFYFVIDRGLSPIKALKASSRATMGVKWELFGFGILCGLINFLGLICLIVGVFVTYPTTLVANALLYRQLSAQTPELAEFGIGQDRRAKSELGTFALE